MSMPTTGIEPGRCMDVLVVGRHQDDAAGHADIGHCLDRWSAVDCLRGTADCLDNCTDLSIEKNGRGEYPSNMFRRLKHPYQPTDGASLDLNSLPKVGIGRCWDTVRGILWSTPNAEGSTNAHDIQKK